MNSPVLRSRCDVSRPELGSVLWYLPGVRVLVPARAYTPVEELRILPVDLVSASTDAAMGVQDSTHRMTTV